MHTECCISQMNIKLLPLKEANENLNTYRSWRHYVSRSKKEGGVTIRGNMVFYCN